MSSEDWNQKLALIDQGNLFSCFINSLTRLPLCRKWYCLNYIVHRLDIAYLKNLSWNKTRLHLQNIMIELLK